MEKRCWLHCSPTCFIHSSIVSCSIMLNRRWFPESCLCTVHIRRVNFYLIWSTIFNTTFRKFGACVAAKIPLVVVSLIPFGGLNSSLNWVMRIVETIVKPNGQNQDLISPVSGHFFLLKNYTSVLVVFLCADNFTVLLSMKVIPQA